MVLLFSLKLCRECRYPLIQVVDVIAHHIGASLVLRRFSLLFLCVLVGLERLSFMKRAKTSVEFDASNVMFVSENKWMKKQSEHDRFFVLFSASYVNLLIYFPLIGASLPRAS